MGAPMNDGFLIVDVKDRVATVTFNNPPANLLSTHVLKELDRHVEQFEADPTVKVVVFTALGRFYCPGADVKELRQPFPVGTIGPDHRYLCGCSNS